MVPEYDEQGRLRGCFVHRTVPSNVLLGRIARGSEDEQVFVAQVIVDRCHPFFFEHVLDHVPSMMLIEAGRQLGIAVCHVFLDVPFGTAFAPTSIQAEFTQYAELDSPIILQSTVRDRVLRRGRLVSMVLDGSFHQLGQIFGKMCGRWTMMPPELYARLRERRQLSLSEDVVD